MIKHFYFKTLIVLATSSSVACNYKEKEIKNPEIIKDVSPNFNPNITYDVMTDQDGNIYKTVKIGNQTWMAQNLRSRTYNDGTPIQYIKDDVKWRNDSIGAYCSYNNISNPDSLNAYGLLYNWQAVNSGKLAPKGWHIPSAEEWETFIELLGGNYWLTPKIRETGINHWFGTNTAATNESGFTALPAGFRSVTGRFNDMGETTYWWSNTACSPTNLYLGLKISYGDNIITTGCGAEANTGFSIRCIKDN